MVSSRPRPQSTDRMLLVEGRSDEQVVLHICNRHSSFSVEGELGSEYVELNYKPSLSFSVAVMGSDSELLTDLRNQLSPPRTPQVVRIIMDADDNIAERWDDIKKRIARVGIDLPANPNPEGTIVSTQGLPRVGVWIMPDNQSSGALEDFARQMLPDGDPVWPLSQEYIEGIPQEHRRFSERNTLKAQFYAWLATRRQPGLMGAAVGAEDLDIDGALCQRFIVWLEELFR